MPPPSRPFTHLSSYPSKDNTRRYFQRSDVRRERPSILGANYSSPHHLRPFLGAQLSYSDVLNRSNVPFCTVWSIHVVTSRYQAQRHSHSAEIAVWQECEGRRGATLVLLPLLRQQLACGRRCVYRLPWKMGKGIDVDWACDHDHRDHPVDSNRWETANLWPAQLGRI